MTNLLGTLEQQIMDIIWKGQKPLTPSDVLKMLESDHAYTTVMTVMQRLSKKGILKREKSGNSYLYSPAKPKKDFVGNMLDNLYKSVFNSYGNIAVAQFVDTIKDDPNAMQSLKEYLKGEYDE